MHLNVEYYVLNTADEDQVVLHSDQVVLNNFLLYLALTRNPDTLKVVIKVHRLFVGEFN